MDGSKFLCFFALLSVRMLVIVNVQAQEQPYANLVAQQLDQRKGLSETSNALFFEDQRNNFWISSIDGLNCFDGVNTKVYRPGVDITGRKFNNIITSRVFVDAHQHHWFTTSDGIHQLSCDRKKMSSWHLRLLQDSSDLESVQLIHLEEKTGLIWLKALSGLYTTYVSNIKDSLKFLNNFSENSQRYVVLSSSTGKVEKIITSNLGANHFNIIEVSATRKVKKIHSVAVKENNYVFNIYVDEHRIAWIACSDGVYKYDVEAKKLVSTKGYTPNLENSQYLMFIDLIPYGERYFWVISYNRGLFLFDKQSQEAPFVRHCTDLMIGGKKVKLDRLDKIFAGRDGTIWLSNWERGLMYFNPSLIKSNYIAIDDHLKKGNRSTISSMQVVNRNKFYFTMPGSGLFAAMQVKNEWRVILINADAPFCKKIWMKNKNELFLVDDNSLYLYSFESNTLRKLFTIPANNQGIKDIVSIDGKSLVVHTTTELFTLDLQSLKIIKNRFTYTKDVNTIFKAGNNHLFINYRTDSLLIYARHSLSPLEYKISGVGRVNHIIASKEKFTFWIASSLGLFKLKLYPKLKLDYWGERDKLLQEALNGIAEDGSGRLWIGSNTGVLRVMPLSQSHSVHRFNEADGILDYQFTPACAENYKGQVLFFGGTNGICHIRPKKVQLVNTLSKVALQRILVNGNKLEIDFCNPSFFQFSCNQRNIFFNYNTSDFVGRNDNEFRYRLYKSRFDNASQPWVSIGNSGNINLAGLNKGKYVLDVIASNSDGIWTDKKYPHRLVFIIEPFWYETIWFYTLLFLLFLAITYFIYRNRLARIQDRANLKETELKILRLQMNPHFIYNCLSAIQSYVLKQNVDKANSLITSFAKLMRRVLTESVKSYLTLSEETELLESYLKTESLRFENRIHYYIEIDPSLDTDEIFIPSMILQPFVENAIVHGFKKKSESSLIKVTFRLHNAMLECCVEDNGGGLGSSVSNAQHQSKAIEITQRRLQLISTKGPEPASLQIINLADEDPASSGVRVRILIPRDLKAD
jgi:ligand-binding sensor domain-containing protein